MTVNRVSYFACGNGDTVLLEAHDTTILTDINYRQDAQNGGDEDALDFAPFIQAACARKRHHLDVFVLTHPDKDHLAGFDELFHLGSPSRWYADPSDRQPKILVDEIWCTSYSIDPNYTTEEARPVIDEIKRRHKLRGTAEAERAGNRLHVISSGTKGTLAGGLIGCYVFGPTSSEAKIPKKKPGEEKEPSSNPSSLIIGWSILVDQGLNQIVLGGDSTADNWERIMREIRNGGPKPSWHVLLAPHHCSRYPLGRKNARDEFVWSDDAIGALSYRNGRGFVVSSSKHLKRDNDDPPCWNAKQKYLKILAGGGDITDNERRRFLCTGGDEDEAPQHIVFDLTAQGPVLRAGGTKTARSRSAVVAGGGYGGSGRSIS